MDTLLRVHASPVPTQTFFEFFGSSAMAPIDCTACSSNIGRYRVPLSSVFQTPPLAAPTNSVTLPDGSCTPAMHEIRPLIAADPMLRAPSPEMLAVFAGWLVDAKGKSNINVVVTVDQQESHCRLMLDSECMMLDDQGVTEEWIVRVQGTEYGPANIETLREWKAEGRLLPVNEARRADVDLWTTAAEIPGLFSVPPVVPISEPLPRQTPIPVARRTFAEILLETVQIYRKGFFQFLGLTLLVLLPSICSQLTTAFVQPLQGSNIDLRSVVAAGVAFLAFIVSIVMWPVYIAGIQILTAELARGNRPSLVAILNEAVRFWSRVAALCIFV